MCDANIILLLHGGINDRKNINVSVSSRKNQGKSLSGIFLAQVIPPELSYQHFLRNIFPGFIKGNRKLHHGYLPTTKNYIDDKMIPHIPETVESCFLFITIVRKECMEGASVPDFYQLT